MRTTRQLRDYIRRLQSAGYALRSEAMLRNQPRADAAIEEFDQLVEELRKSDAHDAEVAAKQRAEKRGVEVKS